MSRVGRNAHEVLHAWLVAALGLLAPVPATAASTAHVIELTQVPCQFLESEGGADRGYKSRSIKDCEAINAKTAKQRVAEAKPLALKSGKYVFRVTNKNVPYELGFWLRGGETESLRRMTVLRACFCAPAISNTGPRREIRSSGQ